VPKPAKNRRSDGARIGRCLQRCEPERKDGDADCQVYLVDRCTVLVCQRRTEDALGIDRPESDLHNHTRRGYQPPVGNVLAAWLATAYSFPTSSMTLLLFPAENPTGPRVQLEQLSAQ
jgi:hypothetical protein